MTTRTWNAQNNTYHVPLYRIWLAENPLFYLGEYLSKKAFAEEPLQRCTREAVRMKWARIGSRQCRAMLRRANARLQKGSSSAWQRQNQPRQIHKSILAVYSVGTAYLPGT